MQRTTELDDVPYEMHPVRFNKLAALLLVVSRIALAARVC